MQTLKKYKFYMIFMMKIKKECSRCKNQFKILINIEAQIIKIAKILMIILSNFKILLIE